MSRSVHVNKEREHYVVDIEVFPLLDGGRDYWLQHSLLTKSGKGGALIRFFY